MLQKDINIKIKTILAVPIIILLIYNSGYVLSTASQNYTVYSLILGILLLLPFILKVNFLRKKIDIYYFAYLFFIISILLTFIFNFNITEVNIYTKYLLIITFAFLLTVLYDFSYFKKMFVNTMVIITVVSLSFYFLFNILDLPINVPVFINVNGIEYYNFYNLYFNFLRFPERNSAIFWEPGLFSSFVIIAILLEVSFKKKSNAFKLMVLFLGLYSSQSTAAFILSFILIILIANKKMFGLKKYFFILSITVVIVILLIYFNQLIEFLYSWKPDLFGKIYESERTLTTRLNSPLLNIKIFLENPIFGVGFSDATILYNNLMSFQDSVVSAQTSTTLYMMASLGIFGLGYTVFLFIGVYRIKHLDIISKFCVFTLMIFIINKEPHNQLVITWCLIFYFLKISSDKQEEEI